MTIPTRRAPLPNIVSLDLVDVWNLLGRQVRLDGLQLHHLLVIERVRTENTSRVTW